MTFPNTTLLSDSEIDRLARKRAGAKMGWYIHACVYVLVNLFLFAVSSDGFGVGRRPWAIYPALGWGLGLALHGVSVFLVGAGSGLRERMVQRERDNLVRQHGQQNQNGAPGQPDKW